MTSTKKLLLLLAIFTLTRAGAQENDDLILLENYDNMDELIITPQSAATPLPFEVDNSQNGHFPPIINQKGWNCAHAARLGYAFAYEANRFRNETCDSTYDYRHIYPPGYTYNMINEGKLKVGSGSREVLILLKLFGVPRASLVQGSFYYAANSVAFSYSSTMAQQCILAMYIFRTKCFIS